MDDTVKKNFAKEILPPEVLNLPKRGFSVPLAKWLRNDLKELMLSSLLEGELAQLGYYDMGIIKNNINQHLLNYKNHSSWIWNMMVLNNWLYRYKSSCV